MDEGNTGDSAAAARGKVAEDDDEDSDSESDGADEAAGDSAQKVPDS